MRGTLTSTQCSFALLRRLCGDARGNVVVLATFVMPIILGIGGFSLDYVATINARSRAQQISDAAALAGAKELSLADSNRQNVPAVVQAVAASYLGAQAQHRPVQNFSIATNIVQQSSQPLQVEVTLAGITKSSFGNVFGLGDRPLTIRSVAIVVGKPNICLLALDPSAMGTLSLQRNAKVVGQNCAVYSNSTHSNGIKAFNSSLLTATVICSAGGKAGGQGNFQPEPLTDCPQFTDPLAGRPEPPIESCSATALTINNQTTILSPGTYCGGLTIKGTSRVTLSPGVYVFKDGPLIVADSGIIEGQNVGMYFSGALSRFSFASGSSISLTAPRNGPMAGMLFFASRAQSGVQYEILSDNARQLLGTIYLPTGSLSIDANQPIADQSAYTAIVARAVTANSGPTVTLNTNYDQTDIPVPDGIKGAGMPVALSK